MERVACACNQCASLCHGDPGWFDPEGVQEAATELGLSFEAFREKYLIIEYWLVDHNDPVYVYAPKKDGQEEQTIAGFIAGREPARCKLLGENGCMLSLETRPIECAVSQQCKKPHNRRKEIHKLWDTEKLQEELVTYKGDAEMPTATLYDVLRLIFG